MGEFSSCQVQQVKYSSIIYNISIGTSHSLVRGMVRIFLFPDIKSLSPDTDITQLVIELDRFHVFLVNGENTIVRQSVESSFVAKHRNTLYELQNKLLTGVLTRDQFIWGGCGWPKVRNFA